MALPQLIDQARRGDVASRRAAIRELGHHPSPEVVAVLVDCLADAPEVADAAVHSLLRIGGEGVARAVVPLLCHHEIGPRSAALDVLIGLGPVAVPVLRELLRHPDRELRKMAAEVLAYGSYPEACPELLQALDDPDPVVRGAAAEAVAAAGCHNAGEELLRRLQREPEEWTQLALAGAVAQAGTPEQVMELLRRVPEGAAADLVRHELTRRQASK